MRFSIVAAVIALVPALGLATPIAAPGKDLNATTPTPTVTARELGSTGSYTVAGLGARKQQLLNCGATVLDLAIAMLETEHMTTDYTYGDGKSYDSANFGVFKQNWGLLRESVGRYKGKSSSDYNTGAELNSNLCLDISSRHESMNYYGEGQWFAGHRNGAAGLANPNTQDIQNYKDAVYWTRNQLEYYNDGKDKTSDVRFWAYVVPI